jgi:hypothetical protein
VSRSHRTACWLAAVLITGAVGGLVASIAPPRLRLIGLFAIALGAVLGWLAGRLALTLRMPSRRVAVLGGLLTGATGCIVATILHWQAFSRELKAAEKPSAGQALVARMLQAAEQNAPTDPESQAALAEFRSSAARALDERRNHRSFRGYLSHRIASLGLTGVLPAALWGIEVLLAGAAGALVIRPVANRPFCSRCDDFLTVRRTHRFQVPFPAPLTDLLPEIADATDGHITLELLTCSCQETSPEIEFTAIHEAAGRTTAGRREVTRDEFRTLSRLMDAADDINGKS